ncbi:MAG: bifunctional RNase H/acid phosphatase [Micrococcales bacterium]|nr:bifunctional RNase H/acid phosphatase [Micrococcales bacterium]
MAQQGRGRPGALIIEADGGSRGNPGPAGYGVVIRDLESGAILGERADFIGEASNNVAEYAGLVAGIRAALELRPGARLDVRMDSRLVVEQMSGNWKIKHPDMRRYAEEARSLLAKVQVAFTWVPRSRNVRADELANEAMDTRAALSKDYGDDTRTVVMESKTAAPSREPEPAHEEPREPAVARDEAVARSHALQALSDAASRAHLLGSGAHRVWSTDDPTVIILVRHGVTDASGTGGSRVLSGAALPGPDLTDEGRAQAQAAAAIVLKMAEGRVWRDVQAPSALVSSPTARARQTAAYLERVLGIEARPDQAFVEADFGAWEGWADEAVEARWPLGIKRWHTDPGYRAPGGECQEDVAVRVRGGVTRLVGDYVGQTCVIVSHAIAIRAALGVALGAPAAAWMRFRVAPGAVTAMRIWTTGQTEVLGVNWTLQGV